MFFNHSFCRNARVVLPNSFVLYLVCLRLFKSIPQPLLMDI